MKMDDKLTYLQKVALRGEIGFALSTSTHDAEIKFRLYLILKEVPEKLRPFIIECAKSSTTFSEDVIDKICLEVSNNTVPVWLWIEEIISDIKLHLALVNSGYAGITETKLSIDPRQERKNLLESAFIYFAREAVIISPKASEQLFDEILNDYELSFLHNACFYLKSCCPEVRNIKKDPHEEVPEDIMSCLFNPKNLLSFKIETKALNALNKAPTKEFFHEFTPLEDAEKEAVIQGNFNIDKNTTHEELSQYISEKISELLQESIRPSKGEDDNTVYVVKKVFTDSGLSTEIRTCKTEAEALDFVKDIIKTYPELTDVCTFKVCLENKHEEKNHRWKKKT